MEATPSAGRRRSRAGANDCGDEAEPEDINTAAPSPPEASRRRASARPMSKLEKEAHDNAMELAAARKLALGHTETRSRFLIDPRTSRWLPYWDGTTTVALCFTALVTPYEVSYLRPDNVVLFVINRVVDVAFGTDIAVQFFLSFPTANSSGTHWVLDLRAIARHYLRGWFLLCAPPAALQIRAQSLRTSAPPPRQDPLTIKSWRPLTNINP